jgi:hypothetical protein
MLPLWTAHASTKLITLLQETWHLILKIACVTIAHFLVIAALEVLSLNLKAPIRINQDHNREVKTSRTEQALIEINQTILNARALFKIAPVWMFLIRFPRICFLTALAIIAPAKVLLET